MFFCVFILSSLRVFISALSLYLCNISPCGARRAYVYFIKRNVKNPSKFGLSEFGGLAGEIFLDHKSYLESNGMVELAKIKSGKLSDFLKSVYEGVSVNEELS